MIDASSSLSDTADSSPRSAGSPNDQKLSLPSRPKKRSEIPQHLLDTMSDYRLPTPDILAKYPNYPEGSPLSITDWREPIPELLMTVEERLKRKSTPQLLPKPSRDRLKSLKSEYVCLVEMYPTFFNLIKVQDRKRSRNGASIMTMTSNRSPQCPSRYNVNHHIVTYVENKSSAEKGKGRRIVVRAEDCLEASKFQFVLF